MDFYQFCQIFARKRFKTEKMNILYHGLRTPNEGINERNPKILADVADKICFGRT